MKILHVNKFLYPRGGAETYMLGLAEVQRAHGHDVHFFSQHDPKNISTADEKYFVPNLELGSFSFATLFKIGRLFWYQGAARRLKHQIRDLKPDIVHIHNIYHQISPSILPVAKKAGIPLVMTVHDFKLVTPTYTLRADNKQPQRSLITRLIVGAEFKFHQWLKVYQKNITCFIAPSQFVREQLIAHGYDAAKIVVIPHAVTAPKIAPSDGSYIFAYGRLDESKGFDTLIRAYATLTTVVPLKIAGYGTEGGALHKLVKELNLEERVKLIGKKTPAEIQELIAHCLFTVFPSRVHETFGLGVIESYMQSKPVIATQAGAFQETIEDGRSGLLVPVDSIDALALALNHLLSYPQYAVEMGKRGKILAQTRYSPNTHYNAIQKIYQNIS